MTDPRVSIPKRKGGDRTPRAGVLWLPAALAGAATWISLSRFHGLTHADSLIPVLSGLYAWEPFFWEQARIGMPIALLASPISDPWHNLLFQTWWSIAGGLALLVLLVRYVHRAPSWPWAAALSVAAFLLLAPPDSRYLLLSTRMNYGTGLALGLTALLVVQRVRRPPRNFALAAAGALSALAHWLNGAVALLLAPLAVARGLLRWLGRREDDAEGGRSPVSRAGVEVALLVGGFAVGQLLAWASPYRLWHLHVSEPSRWLTTWSRLAASTWDELRGPWALYLIAGGAVGLAIGIWQRARGRRAEGLRAAVPLLAAAATYYLLLGASEWVVLNHYHHRYALPAVLCLHTAVVVAAAVPLAERLRSAGNPGVPAAACLLLGASLLASYGPPSPERARRALDERVSGLGDDVRRGGVTHLLGSYSPVWTTVFHSNLVNHEQGRPGTVWGIAHRAGPTADQWWSVPLEEWRVGVLPDDPSRQEIARIYGLPELVEVGRTEELIILRPRSVVEGRQRR